MHTIWKNNVHQQCNVVLLVLFLVVAQIVTNPFGGGGGGTGGVVFVLGQPPQSGSTTHHYTVEDYAIIENVREDNVEGILKALNDGGDINVIGPGGQTPLMLAVLSGKLESVKILLEKGADVTIGERDGYTPMHGAGFQGRAEIAKILIEHGLDPLDAHKDGFTAIHRAAWGKEERHTETIRVLMDVGKVPHDYKAPGTGQTALEMTKNPSSIALLEERAALALADGDESSSEL